MELPDEASRTFPYEIERQVGEGSMGAVYLARETNLDRKVAIKTLRGDFLEELEEEARDEATSRFLQEARAIAKVSHRNIVSIYRLGTERGAAFIAMEWLEGRSLEEILEEDDSIEMERIGRWIVELLEALDAAHSHDIVHRDIKPGNVMIEPGDHVKLTDFGVAQVRDSKLVQTQTGSMIGTPLYAAPEQLSDSRVDRRADLYSAGVLLYKLLTGEVPFYDSNVVKLMQIIMKKQPPPVREKNPMIPEPIADVVMQALSKQPSERFSTAREMAEVLVEALPDVSASVAGNSSMGAVSTSPGESNARIEVAETVVASGTTPADLVASTVTDWKPRALGPTRVERLLERLMESPVHADAFSGAARFDDRIVLVSRGLVYGAIDIQSGRTGDVVLEEAPAEARATLFPVPERFESRRLIPGLSSLLHRPDRKHVGLETAYTDMVKLYRKLQDENFSGAVRLKSEDGRQLAFLLLDGGEPLLDIFSDGWESAPTDRRWQAWLGDRALRADVEGRRVVLSAATYRRELEDLRIEVDDGDVNEGQDVESTAATGDLQVSPSSLDNRASRASTVWGDIYETDIAFQLLQWLRRDLGPYLEERNRTKGWKYLAGWTELIDQARLYHQLDRPDQGEADFFDLVTFDGEDKVLHVARRMARGTVRTLNSFIDDVEAAKKARIETGDIGGAVMVADDFDEEAVEAYVERVRQEDSSWFFSLQESMTGYEGFVRIGSRRGFHLLLLRRVDRGFEPIMPPKNT